MVKIVALANQKGGVGKTTTAVNLAAFCGVKNKKVLLIDLDPQGNSTSGVGILKKHIKHSSYDIILNNVDPKDAVVKTKYKNLHIIPSAIELAAAEIEIADAEFRTELLKNSIFEIKNEYDFVIIDCPPSLGLLTLNALTATDSVIVPIQCEYYALEGLSQLISTIRQVKKLYNPFIELEGVLLTMYDGRLNLTMQVAGEVKRFFLQKVYKTPIPRNVKLSESPSFGEPVYYYDKFSKGAKSYEKFAEEFIKSNKKHTAMNFK